MEGDQVQPTRISKEEYTRFKQYVQDVHGKTRGHLSTEIENALREYRQPDDAADPLVRIEDDIATIKAAIAETESDGGASVATPAPSNDDAHTQTASDKPSPKASRMEKVEYLIDQRYDRDGGSVNVGTILEDVSDLYSFEERTAQKYVQPVIDTLDAKRHPNNTNLLVWGERLEALREQLADE